MPNAPDDDWRLRGPKDYLLGIELERIPYSPSSPKSDHDHREFCWAKFTDSDAPDVLLQQKELLLRPALWFRDSFVVTGFIRSSPTAVPDRTR